MPTLRRVSPATLALALALGQAATARAHGGLPATTSIAPRAGDAADIALGTNFGILLSRDGGKVWKHVCEEAMGYLNNIRPALAWLSDGTILAAAFDVLAVSKDGGCTWSSHPFFAIRGASDLAVDPANDRRLFATSQRFGAENGVFRSTDGGQTFAATNAGATDLFFTTVRIAPSEPRRIYAGAYRDRPVRGVLYRSDDGGDVFSSHELAVDSEGGFFVLAVDPSDADVLFVVADSGLESSLYRSDDGGATLRHVLLTTDVLRGATVSPDGKTVLVAGNGRVFKSTDAGFSFVELARPQGNACVARIGDEIWACGYTRIDGWALARSADYGDTWQGIFAMEDIAGVIDCPAGTPVHDTCLDIWPLVEAIIARPRADGGAAASDASQGSDAGAPTDAAGGSAGASAAGGSGCGCRAGGRAAAAPLGVVLPVSICLLALRRRGRRGRPALRQDAVGSQGRLG